MQSCLEALLVEDNHSDAQLVETVVMLADTQEPPHLQHVDRFAKALDAVKTTNFDLVLLDLHLPDAEGTALISQLKKVAPTTTVVVITGLGDMNTEAAAFSEGADDYLVKSRTFAPQRIAELGYIDVGNLLVERLHSAVHQSRLAAALEPEAIPKNIVSPELTRPEQTQLDLPLQERLYSSYIRDADDNLLPIIHPDILEAVTEATPCTSELTPIEHFVQTTLYSVGITLMSSLGLIHMEAGAYEKAEPLLAGALNARQQLLGQKHPDVIVSLHNLATLYDNKGQYLEAEALFYEALKLCEDVFGTDSAITRKFRKQALIISRLNQGMDRAE